MLADTRQVKNKGQKIEESKQKEDKGQETTMARKKWQENGRTFGNQEGDRWVNRMLKDEGKDENIDLKQRETRLVYLFPCLCHFICCSLPRKSNVVGRELQEREM